MDSAGTAVLDVRRPSSGRAVQVPVRMQLYHFGSLGDFMPTGVRIVEIAPDTPAARALLAAGDVVVSLGNRPANNQANFELGVNLSGGMTVAMVRRGGFGPVVPVPMELMNNSLGCWCESSTEGMAVCNAPAGTMAARLGLRRGDIIIRADGRATPTLAALQATLEQARNSLALDVRSGTTGQILNLQGDLGR
jgi:S1-C subfamily serine protease